MITSQEQLDRITEIVTGLDERLAPAGADNRRRAPRVIMRAQMTITLLSGISPSPVDVYSRNISSSGLGFVCRRMFRREERVAIPLRIPKAPAKLLLARITFSRYIGGGYYEMGAEFMECVSDESANGGTGRIPSRWLQSAGNVRISEPKPAKPAAAAAAPAIPANAASDAPAAVATAAAAETSAAVAPAVKPDADSAEAAAAPAPGKS